MKYLLSMLVACAACGHVQAEDWPSFLGPRHDGTSAETGLNLDWPKDGPPVLWKARMGTGYSAPSIVGDRLILHDRIRDEEVVSCLDATSGKEIWKQAYPTSYRDRYGYNNGPRCAPAIAGDLCFTLGAEGMLTCLQVNDGKVVWQNKLSESFSLPDWFFGMACSPIAYKDSLLVMVGGQPNSGVVAFDQKTGKVLWEAIGKQTWDGVVDRRTGQPYRWTGSEQVVSYASPMVASLHGKDHLLCFCRQGLVSVDPEIGKQNFAYWFRPRVNDSVNAVRPVVVGDQILLSAAYRLGSVLLSVSEDGNSVTEDWEDSESMLAHWSTPIHVDGYVYGFSGRHKNEGELRCIEWSSGEGAWSTTGWERPTTDLSYDRETRQVVDAKTKQPIPYPYYGRGSLLKIEDHFIAFGESGTLAVVKITPEGYSEVCRCTYPELKYPTWTAPVLSNGRLFVRSETALLCLDLRK